MFSFFRDLCDAAKTLSSNRFAFLFTTAVSNIAFWTPFAYVFFTSGNCPNPPAGAYIAYGLANGIVGLGKLGQNITDNQKTPQPPEIGG